MTILTSRSHRLETNWGQMPSEICAALGLEHQHVEGRYDPCRGWQIVTLHQGRSLYLDCDEKNAVVRVI